jgi:CMP-N,N'-diacetyllegionaminic acid synthase
VRTLGLIPARGGSKGLPGKNIRPLAGKPLLAWTIDAARASGVIDRLVISTDDDGIAAVAREHGCEAPFLRPAHLATDESPTIDTVMHALETLGDLFDILVLLQPTSPFRTDADIAACVRRCTDEGMPACVGIIRATESPFWMFTQAPSGELEPVVARDQLPTRRQLLPPAFLINGAVYAARVDWLRQHRSFFGPGACGWEMPAERSLDIDTLEDFKAAECRLAAASHFPPCH